MSYGLFLYIENEDEADSDPAKAVWSIDHFDDVDEALDLADVICHSIAEMTGVEPRRIDDEEDE